ncbi:hypothetical protein [Rhizobium leguminosarum]|uniref:hypothetical protein n=1 Tax=Rhizobium leguminosarum TaxID=384 RepID=UPI0015BA319B|nr:hypothetical protein [Rhizobium leguminosarum]
MPEKGKATDMEALREALIDDILSMTEEKILAEAKEDNVDLDGNLRKTKALFDQAKKSAAKGKLKAAQAAVANNVFSNVVPMDRERFAKYDAALRTGKIGTSELTLAARNGSGLSEEDRRKLIEDMIELGIPLPDEE